MKRLYAYAVVKGKISLPGKTMGVSFAGPVSLINVEDMSVVVSSISPKIKNAHHLEKKLSADVDWARKNILAHYQVTYELAKENTLIPFKFGSIMSSEKDIEKKIRNKQVKLEKIFQRIENREEWAVKLSLDSKKFEKEIGNTLNLETEPTLSGLDWLVEKKNETKLKSAVQKSVDDNIAEFEGMLKKECEDMTANMPSSSSDKDMATVANWACLLKKEEVERLRKRILNMEKNKAFQITLTGPWPPYNFVSKKL